MPVHGTRASPNALHFFPECLLAGTQLIIVLEVALGRFQVPRGDFNSCIARPTLRQPCLKLSSAVRFCLLGVAGQQCHVPGRTARRTPARGLHPARTHRELAIGHKPPAFEKEVFQTVGGLQLNHALQLTKRKTMEFVVAGNGESTCWNVAAD